MAIPIFSPKEKNMNRKRRANSGLIIFVSIASSVILAAMTVCIYFLAKLDSENAQTLPEATQTTAVTATYAATPKVTVVTTTTVKTTTAAPETTEETSEETTEPAETTTTAEETTEPAETETAVTASVPSYGNYDKSHFANDLFIGDSIYTGLYLYEYFPQKQVFAKIGLNPQSARTAEINGSAVQTRAKELQPARIFILLGTNGLAYMDASYMADNMKSLVGNLHEASPDSSIYIVSIPPVTYVHELQGQETMAMVRKYNGLLESAADECDAVFLDLCSELSDDSGYFASDYAEADGLHFLGAAYVRMLSFFDNETR